MKIPTETRVCACGTTFQTDNPYRRKCQKDCGRASAQAHQAHRKRRAANDLTFIGVDGEGITRPDGDHHYVLLSVGDRSLRSPNGDRLTWEQIFPFLWECFQARPDAVYAGFFLGYDFTQWLRTLPEGAARHLLTDAGIASRKRRDTENPTPYPVRLGRWEFDLHAGRRFKLRPYAGPNNRLPWLYVCDAGSYYQTSFLAAIDPSQWPAPIVSPDEYQVIVQGKGERSSKADLDEDMVRYNVMENEVLGRLLGTLNRGFVEAGIHLGREQFYGPGQAAGAWLKLIGAPLGEQVRDAVPHWALEAARCTYFGGWFEIFAHGIVPGQAFEYDINSAYPHVIASLPCLLHGAWTQGGGSPPPLAPGGWRMVRASVEGSNLVAGAMLHRTPQGRVLRPRRTAGWYWWHELGAAQAAGLVDQVDVQEWIDYAPCGCTPPIAEIARLYLRRLEIGKNSPGGKALKLLYNSTYGKFAQSIGSPPFSNSVWASLITAGCRTMIAEAIATHPTRTADLLMIATDGVTFRTPHPSLDLSESELGWWEEKERSNLTLWMPGIYWDDTTRARLAAGESPKLKSRGVNAGDLARRITSADEQFAAMRPGDVWPSVQVGVAFNMVTAVQALARGTWHLAGVVDTAGVRELDSDPDTKRVPEAYLECCAASQVDPQGTRRLAPDDPTGGPWFLRTLPYDVAPGGQVDSTPYDQRFGDELRAAILDEDLVTPDGSLSTLLGEALRPGDA